MHMCMYACMYMFTHIYVYICVSVYAQDMMEKARRIYEYARFVYVLYCRMCSLTIECVLLLTQDMMGEARRIYEQADVVGDRLPYTDEVLGGLGSRV